MPGDSRLRVVEYNPGQVVMAYALPGQTFRIRLDPKERVVPGGLVVSDQATMEVVVLKGTYTEEDQKADSQAAQNSGSGDQSCDRNMCRSVVLNTVYIQPRRELDPQSFFLRTEWCPDGPGLPSCEPGEYAIELHTQADQVNDARIKAAFFGIQYRYTTRETAWRIKKAAEARQEAGKRAKEWRDNNPPPALPSVPDQVARWDLAYCGSAPDIAPDAAWTDGRTTYLRYNGTRRIPNIYERRTDGVETLTAYTVEPEAFGNVIRIGSIKPFFYLRDGDRASCIINVQYDVEGRHEMAVAPIVQPLAGRPRRGAP